MRGEFQNFEQLLTSMRSHDANKSIVDIPVSGLPSAVTCCRVARRNRTRRAPGLNSIVGEVSRLVPVAIGSCNHLVQLKSHMRLSPPSF